MSDPDNSGLSQEKGFQKMGKRGWGMGHLWAENIKLNFKHEEHSVSKGHSGSGVH